MAFTVEITPEQLTGIETKLAAAGTIVSVPDPEQPNQYTISNKAHGIAATAVYDPAADTLAVTITKKPFFVPEPAIKNGIEEALKS